MNAIYKYPLPDGAGPTIDLPVGAEILCVQVQAEQPCIWATVDLHADTEPRNFYVAVTGGRITNRDKLVYIGTFQLHNGSFVGHLFEVHQ